MKLFTRRLGAALFGLAIATTAQAEDPVKIALVHGISGHSFEVFSKQAQTGFELGIEYATGGTNMVKGHPIEIIHKDTQFKPDVARAVLAEARQRGDTSPAFEQRLAELRTQVPPRVAPQMASTMDLFPTLLQLAGAAPPGDGRSACRASVPTTPERGC